VNLAPASTSAESEYCFHPGLFFIEFLPEGEEQAVPMWEVELGGKWERFEATVGKALVEAKARGAEEYRFDMKGQPMVVNFKTMTQTNVKSGKSRPVRDTSSYHSGSKGHGKGHGKGGPVQDHDGKGGGPVRVHGSGDVYVHETPTAPPAPSAPAAEKPEAKPAPKKESRFGFKTGVAVGTTAAVGTAVGVGLATGVITGEEIGDAFKDAGEAIAGAAEDVGEFIVDAADDVADFVTGA
jgi:hypothetical protein